MTPKAIAVNIVLTRSPKLFELDFACGFLTDKLGLTEEAILTSLIPRSTFARGGVEFL